ncbi:hypothetical protein HY469_02765, partial [Candidatus Roizmanbacteria bacterium]|nr:hypothetical protein [Candidatus Roizmanbacteria bacterium]
LGFLCGLSFSILAIALIQSRPLQDEITIRRRQVEINELIKNRGAKLSFGDPQTVSVGEEFIVPIVMTSEEFHVNAADIEISYDPRMIEVTAIENGAVFDHLVADEINEEEQVVVFSVAMEPDKTGFTGTSTIATITARAISTGTTTFAFIYDKNERNDTNVSVSDLPGEDVLEMTSKLQIVVE